MTHSLSRRPRSPALRHAHPPRPSFGAQSGALPPPIDRTETSCLRRRTPGAICLPRDRLHCNPREMLADCASQQSYGSPRQGPPTIGDAPALLLFSPGHRTRPRMRQSAVRLRPRRPSWRPPANPTLRIFGVSPALLSGVAVLRPIPRCVSSVSGLRSSPLLPSSAPIPRCVSSVSPLRSSPLLPSSAPIPRCVSSVSPLLSSSRPRLAPESTTLLSPVHLTSPLRPLVHPSSTFVRSSIVRQPASAPILRLFPCCPLLARAWHPSPPLAISCAPHVPCSSARPSFVNLRPLVHRSSTCVRSHTPALPLPHPRGPLGLSSRPRDLRRKRSASSQALPARFCA
jgi:hypothetical protein